MPRKRKNASPPPRDVLPAKHWLFKGILLAIPFVLLFGIEGILRILDYNGNLNLVIEVPGKDLYQINRNVAQRYFGAAGTTVPEPADQTFARVKSSKTKRIFCLGESTMAGFPYEFHATAPSFLRDRLRILLPDYDIEVINVGLSAVGSYVVTDFMEELLRYQPDLFIVYVGHNEFYGAYGVGSRVAVHGPNWLTRLTIALLKYRFFLLARNLFVRIAGQAESAPHDATLMEQVVANQSIPYGSALYNEARDIYHANLERMMSLAQSRGVPVIFSTVVSNIKDQPPFSSRTGLPEAEPQRAEVMARGQRADSLMHAGLFAEALPLYQDIVTQDSNSARAWYNFGKAAEGCGETDKAREALLRARDLDALRFRMSEDFQRDLVTLCAAHNVPLARVDSAFEGLSPHGLVGTELILEHLHPNIRGYFLMGKTFAATISTHGLLVPPSAWHWERDRSDPAYFDSSAVCRFDSIQGAIKVTLLTHKWPFVSPSAAPYRFEPRTEEEFIIFQYVQKRSGWSQTRYALAELYQHEEQWELARRECLALAKAVPTSYEPLLRIADYFRMEQRDADAAQWYRRSSATEENPYAHTKLGIILLEENRAPEALAEFQRARDVDRVQGGKLGREVLAGLEYLLGVANAKAGHVDAACDHLRQCLLLNPRDAEAQQLLEEISMGRKTDRGQ